MRNEYYNKNIFLRICCLFIFQSLGLLAFSQNDSELDYGLNADYSFEKKINNKFSANISEELRLRTSEIVFERASITAGLDYSAINNPAFKSSLKIGLYYANMFIDAGNKLILPRNRFMLNITYKYNFYNFYASLRTRLEATYIRKGDNDDLSQSYKVLNKFEIGYAFKEAPFGLFASCDLATDLMAEKFGIARYRSKLGTSWNVKKNNELQIYLKWDEFPDNKTNSLIALGVSYLLKL